MKVERLAAATTPQGWLEAIGAAMPVRAQPGLPAHLQGVFWMNGNHPENLVAPGAGDFKPAARFLSLKISRPGVWVTGRKKSHYGHDQSCCTYLFNFNEAYDYATIDFVVCLCCHSRCWCLPSCLVHFDMQQDEADADKWRRNNRFCCRSCTAGNYDLIRILKPSGAGLEPTPHFERAVGWLSEQEDQWFVAPSAAVAPDAPAMDRGSMVRYEEGPSDPPKKPVVACPTPTYIAEKRKQKLASLV